MTRRTIATRIAGWITAIHNCQASANTVWLANHRESIADIMREHAPSGSGIDSGTQFIESESTGEKLVFCTAFHHTDENGSYCGWSHHKIIARPSFVFGFTLRITGPNTRDIKDYLSDVFAQFLETEV